MNSANIIYKLFKNLNNLTGKPDTFAAELSNPLINVLSSYRSEIRTSFLLAYPVMLSQLGHVMMGVSDNVMVGHLGARELAAAGLANVAFNVLLLFGIGVSYAITPLVATADGEKNIFNVNETLRHGLVINVITSLVLVMVVFFGKNILYHIDQPPEVVALSIPYLEIITFSIIPVLVFQTYRQFSEGLSNTWVPMIMVLGCNVVNIILNYVLIYGHAGFPKLGLNGAGWATFTSRIVMAGGLAAFIYYAPPLPPIPSWFCIRKLFESTVQQNASYRIARRTAIHIRGGRVRLLTRDDGLAWNDSAGSPPDCHQPCHHQLHDDFRIGRRCRNPCKS